MKKLLLIFLLINFSIIIRSQTFEKEIDELIFAHVENKLFNGAVTVAVDNNIIYSKGFGFADVEWQIPVTSDTKFRIGSVTKQFTAAIIMKFVEEGKIALDGKLSEYLPYYRNDIGDKVTIHMLLNHSSGIPSYTSKPTFFRDDSRDHYDPKDFVIKFCSDDLSFEPGSKFSYNNSGYFILGAIIEEISGKSYEQVLNELIIEPLSLTNTGFDSNRNIIMKRAKGYNKGFTGVVNSDYLDMALPFSAGSMYSTPEDLFKWNLALFSGKVINQESVKKMIYHHINTGNNYYGYGLQMDKTVFNGDTLEAVSHGGGVNGFSANNFTLPEKGIHIISVSNFANSSIRDLTNQILKILQGKEASNPKIQLASFIYDKMKIEGVEVIDELFNQLKESPNFIYSERDFNSLGYELLNDNKYDEALAVFRLNKNIFPLSSNAYDSYAEAWMMKGINDSAIFYYKKSLELDSLNDNAVAQLAKLGIEIQSKQDIVLTEEQLMEYTGEFKLTEGFFITITVEGNSLFAQATGQPKFQIKPIKTDIFILKEADAKLEFIRNEVNKVESFILHQNGQKLPCIKI